jgi:hypothetical protein
MTIKKHMNVLTVVESYSTVDCPDQEVTGQLKFVEALGNHLRNSKSAMTREGKGTMFRIQKEKIESKTVKKCIVLLVKQMAAKLAVGYAERNY